MMEPVTMKTLTNLTVERKERRLRGLENSGGY